MSIEPDKDYATNISLNNSSKSAANVSVPLSCVLQLSRVGRFSFVEEKTYITPPALPPVPGTAVKQKFSAGMIANYVIFWLLALLLGIILKNQILIDKIGEPIITAGFVLLAVAFVLVMLNRSGVAHNKKCAREQADWNGAWDNWNETVFLNAFREDTNGVLTDYLRRHLNASDRLRQRFSKVK